MTVTIGPSSALPTLTALIASTASAVHGQSVTFTATVSDLSAGGATPNGGTVTFSDQNGTLDTETLVDGVATFTTSSLAVGTITVTASYGGTTDFAPSTTGTIVTAVGNGTAGYQGDNGPATAAELNNPHGLAVDSAGDLFIADTQTTWSARWSRRPATIITVAGNGTAGYSGDGGPATAAELNDPRGLAVDSAGNLFIADSDNNVVREVVKATGDHHHRRRQRHRRLQRRQRTRHRRRAEQPPRPRRRLRGRPVHRRLSQQRDPGGGRRRPATSSPSPATASPATAATTDPRPPPS